MGIKYTEKAFLEIIKKAAKLEQKQNNINEIMEDSYTIDEIKEFAAEAGISPKSIDLAMETPEWVKGKGVPHIVANKVYGDYWKLRKLRKAIRCQFTDFYSLMLICDWRYFFLWDYRKDIREFIEQYEDYSGNFCKFLLFMAIFGWSLLFLGVLVLLIYRI